jgi:hypothetical protein
MNIISNLSSIEQHLLLAIKYLLYDNDFIQAIKISKLFNVQRPCHA